MNFYTCTVKIIKEPKWLRLNNAALSKLILVKPINKKNKDGHIIVAIAKREVAQLVFDHYKKQDTIVVEGYVYIRKSKIQLKDNIKKYKIKKYVVMKIQKIHPVSNMRQ